MCGRFGRNVKKTLDNCVAILIAKLKPLKDQILFVFFSLFMYILDIGFDVKQAYNYKE